MSKIKFPLDRSAMFSALLDLSPEYRKLDTRVGERVTTSALEAWYRDPGTDMYAFARTWLRGRDLTKEFGS